MAAKEAKGARKKETAVKADIKEVSKSSFLELLKMGGISRKSTAQ